MPRGTRFARASWLLILAFIPDPDLERADDTRISGASGITSSHDDSVVYAADVAPRQIRKYERR